MSQDDLQNQRLRDVEKRLTSIESKFAAIMAEINLSKNMLKFIAVLAGTALGVDVVPIMMEGN